MVQKLFTTLILIFSLLFQNAAVLPLPRCDDISFKAVLISDIHADANPIRDRSDVLREAFAALGRSQPDADALVMSGDLTNSGDFVEYVNLINSLNVYCRIPVRVPEIGNHDSWHHSDDPDYAKAVRNFKTFCLWNGVKTDKVYYEKDIKGYVFLAMGVEDGDFGDPFTSDAQLDWLDARLGTACKTERPVFLICHKPIEKMGAAKTRLHEILLRHAEEGNAPIIYVSGHDHSIGANTYRQEHARLIHLNLPSFQYTDGGGLGFIAEVTAHTLLLTGMNFMTGLPLDGYRYEIALQEAKAE